MEGLGLSRSPQPFRVKTQHKIRCQRLRASEQFCGLIDISTRAQGREIDSIIDSSSPAKLPKGEANMACFPLIKYLLNGLFPFN